MNENYLKVINVLGEKIKELELDVACLKYANEKLEKELDFMTKLLNEKNEKGEAKC